MRVLLVLAVMTSPALAADQVQRAKNDAAAYIGMAWHCRAITGNFERYERAVSAGPERLARAGMTAQDADAFLQGVVAAIQKQEPMPLTAKFCSDILDNIERR